MKYHLYLVRIFVTDWPAALAFCRDTLEMPVDFESEEMGWAELGIEGSSLALERVADDDEEGRSMVGRFLGVSLEVDDVEAVYKTLCERGVTFSGPPARQPWGGTLAHFEDPEGNVLTLLGGNADG